MNESFKNGIRVHFYADVQPLYQHTDATSSTVHISGIADFSNSMTSNCLKLNIEKTSEFLCYGLCQKLYKLPCSKTVWRGGQLVRALGLQR